MGFDFSTFFGKYGAFISGGIFVVGAIAITTIVMMTNNQKSDLQTKLEEAINQQSALMNSNEAVIASINSKNKNELKNALEAQSVNLQRECEYVLANAQVQSTKM
jgi:low affinity Fe/Cu permease